MASVESSQASTSESLKFILLPVHRSTPIIPNSTEISYIHEDWVITLCCFLPFCLRSAPLLQEVWTRLHRNTRSRIKWKTCLWGCPQWVNCKTYFTKSKNMRTSEAFDQLLYIGRIQQWTKALNCNILQSNTLVVHITIFRKQRLNSTTIVTAAERIGTR